MPAFLGFLGPLGFLQKAIGGALFLAVIGLAIWGWRVDSLRADWKTVAEDITVVTSNVVGDPKLKPKGVSAAVEKLGSERSKYLRERNNANAALMEQTRSLLEYQAEAERARVLAAEQQALIVTLVEQREVWITRAQTAATRTERNSCEDELREVEGALDAVRAAGF